MAYPHTQSMFHHYFSVRPARSFLKGSGAAAPAFIGRCLHTLVVGAVGCFAILAPLAVDAQTNAAGAFGTATADGIQAQYQRQKPQLTVNAFGKPIAIESRQSTDHLQGDVYAVIDHPFAEVSAALQPAPHWCEILMLHLNTKQCVVASAPLALDGTGDAPSAILSVTVGGKHEERAGQSQPVDFAYRIASASSRLLDVRMKSDSGPMATRDYQLWVQAAPIEGGRTFMHLHYSYGFGMAAKLAMNAYLATVGRDKVGFSKTTPSAGDTSAEEYVDGVRGVVERNAMRYYLAVDAYLDSLSQPPASQRENRIAAWFDATERYPRQLHELDRNEYLTMKRNELAALGKTR